MERFVGCINFVRIEASPGSQCKVTTGIFSASGIEFTVTDKKHLRWFETGLTQEIQKGIGCRFWICYFVAGDDQRAEFQKRFLDIFVQVTQFIAIAGSIDAKKDAGILHLAHAIIDAVKKRSVLAHLHDLFNPSFFKRFHLIFGTAKIQNSIFSRQRKCKNSIIPNNSRRNEARRR